MSWRSPRTVLRIGCVPELLGYAWRSIGSLGFALYEARGLALLRRAVLSGRRNIVMRGTRRICAMRLTIQIRSIFSILRRNISFDMWRLGIFEWSRRGIFVYVRSVSICFLDDCFYGFRYDILIFTSLPNISWLSGLRVRNNILRDHGPVYIFSKIVYIFCGERFGFRV